jgi:hypothetical protein
MDRIIKNNCREGVIGRAKFIEYPPSKRVLKFRDTYGQIPPFSTALAFPYIQFWHAKKGYVSSVEDYIISITCSLEPLVEMDQQIYSLPLPHIESGEPCGGYTIKSFWNSPFKLNYGRGNYSLDQIRRWAETDKPPKLSPMNLSYQINHVLNYQ